MINFAILQSKGLTPSMLMDTYNISVDVWNLIKAAPDRDFLANGAAQRVRGSLYHKALHGYDLLKSHTY